MADDRKIVIELTAVGTSDEDSDKENDEEEDADQRSKKIKKVIKQTAQWAANEIASQATYQFEKYVTLSEDYKTQIMVTNIKATVSKVISLAKSTYASAKLGFEIGGPGGAVVGATLGATMFGISTALQLNREYSTQSLNLEMNDRQARFAQSRLGLIDNGRGTQN